jgi:N6-adenosine-specific RNA methylase IME4
MSLDEICALPVGSIAAPNRALFLWITDPMLPVAFKVIEAWGFTLKTVAFTWTKLNAKSLGYFIGCGYWTRANPEMCLLATRGLPKRLGRDVRQLMVAPEDATAPSHPRSEPASSDWSADRMRNCSHAIACRGGMHGDEI